MDPHTSRKRHGALHEFLEGMAIAVVLTAVNVAVEHSAFGRRVMRRAGEEVHLWLATGELSVAVVDLKALRDNDEGITPRAELREIASALARSGATAVGIDVDFSPRHGREPTAEDRAFFKDMLALTQGSTGARRTPIVLGVYRTRRELRAAWLGEERFAGLAAHLIVTEDVPPVVPTVAAVGPADEELWSMSSTLVRATNPNAFFAAADWPRIARMDFRPSEHGEAHRGEMVVDTSAIPELERNCIRLTNASGRAGTRESYAAQIERQAERVRGRVVVLGDVTGDGSGMDRFSIPGRAKQPGAYVHACAVQTFRDGFLREVTPLGTILFDLGSAALVFGSMAAARAVARRRKRTPPRQLALYVVLFLLSVGVTVAAALAGAAWLRVIWSGYPIVIGAAVAHLVIEVIADQRHSRGSGSEHVDRDAGASHPEREHVGGIA